MSLSRIFPIRSSIPGLLILKHELEFLGLFDVEERGSARQYLPAKKVCSKHLHVFLSKSKTFVFFSDNR